jgi:hypothetical protein
MCTLQRVEMEISQRIPEDIEQYGALEEQQMERRAQVRGLLALVSIMNAKKQMEFVNRDLSAAINIRRRTVLDKRPAALTQTKLVGQPLKVESHKDKLKPAVGGRSKTTERRLHVGVGISTLSALCRYACMPGLQAASMLW